jgi:hypothetical protein
LHISPKDAWNFTLSEYILIAECDEDNPFDSADESCFSIEAIEDFEARHSDNRAKLLHKKSDKIDGQ